MKPSKWKKFYHNETRNIEITLADGRIDEFCVKNIMIQKAINKTWYRRVFSDTYSASVRGKELIEENKLIISPELDIKIDLSDMFQATTAYGEILVEVDTWSHDYPLITYYTEYSREYIKNELVYVKFSKQFKTIDNGVLKKENKRVEYFYDENGTVVRKVNDIDEEITGLDKLPVFISDMPDKALDGWSNPVYADAYVNILEANEAYSENTNDRVISRKYLLMPKDMTERSRNKEDGGVSYINKDDRIFRAYHTDDSLAKPQYVDGAYDPEPHIKDVNLQIKLAGLNSGLGTNFLTLDQKTSLKTAEEVRSDDQEAVISEDILRGILFSLMTNLITQCYDVDSSDIEYNFIEDSTEAPTVRDKRLLSEFMAGLITKEQYHIARGIPEDEVRDLLPENNIDEEVKNANDKV